VHDLVGRVVLGRCGTRFGVQESMHWTSKLRKCEGRGGRGLCSSVQFSFIFKSDWGPFSSVQFNSHPFSSVQFSFIFKSDWGPDP